jgi:hypothetical protein
LAVAEDNPKNNVVGFARTGAPLLNYYFCLGVLKVFKYLIGF